MLKYAGVSSSIISVSVYGEEMACNADRESTFALDSRLGDTTARVRYILNFNAISSIDSCSFECVDKNIVLLFPSKIVKVERY